MEACRTTPTGMRDKDIRAQLETWLTAEYSYDPSTVICHELAIPRPSARIDLAVINGVLAGFEIKSDFDSLMRLPRQVASFSCVFERATLVTTIVHSRKAQQLLPDWWGVLVLDGKSKFRRVKRGRLNRGLIGENALHLLNRSELLAIAGRRNLPVDRRLRRAAIATAISQKLRISAIMSEVRDAIKSRPSLADHRSRQMAVDI